MTTQEDGITSQSISLTDDDVAFLFSVLRDPGHSQPVTTQELIDALRSRAGR